jgi:hypothetical protein
MAVSSSDRASRTEPSAARTITGSVAGSNSLPLEDPLQRCQQEVRRHRTEVEALHAGEDRGREIPRVGGGEHEYHVGGRLLQRLEQRVEGRLGQLVNLIDDVDLVAPTSRRVLDILAQGADLVDATIGGAVDLHDVHTRGGVEAHGAGAARLGALPLRAQQRARQQPRGGRLADATGSREEIGVGDPPRRQRVAQRARDRVLPDDLVERRRSILPGQYLVAHRNTK